MKRSRIGEKHSMLTIVDERIRQIGWKNRVQVDCECECGGKKTIMYNTLQRDGIHSCWCYMNSGELSGYSMKEYRRKYIKRRLDRMMKLKDKRLYKAHYDCMLTIPIYQREVKRLKVKDWIRFICNWHVYIMGDLSVTKRDGHNT